ncbi:COG4 transport protein domain-containing protein [Phthorimaea operculella]|nr:COG4 transport protein domain-containing protein [Phthorimaea operculella]
MSEEAVYADALTRVLEAGGAAIERARVAASVAAPGYLPRAVKIIQPTVCLGARRVYNELRVARRLDQGDPRRILTNPLAAEPTLAELALAHSRVQLYFAFLRRKTEADASTLKDEQKKASMAEIEKIITECDLTRTAQDLLGHYLGLERYFLEESINKALKMSAPQVGATTSSLVDDVFFIARKVIRRSLSTGSVDGACAVLNDAAALLEREAAAALRRWLRSPPPDPLQLPPPSVGGAMAGLDAVGSLAQRLNRDVDAQRLLFIAHMNEAEAGAEWSERLAAEACADAEPLHRNQQQRDMLHSCASGLGSAAAAFRAAHELALAGIKAALKPRVMAWAEVIADPTVDEGSAAAAFRAAHELALAGIKAALKPRVMAWAEVIADPTVDEGSAAAAFRAAHELALAGIKAALKPRVMAWAEVIANPTVDEGSAAAAFRAAHELALAGIKAALKPRVMAWAEVIADPTVDEGSAAAAFRAAHELALAGIKAALKPRVMAWAEVIADPTVDEGSAAAAFRAAHELALAGIKAALKPRVMAWAEVIADPNVDEDEIEDDADLLPTALDTLNESARTQLSTRSADDLLAAVVGDIAQRAQTRILHHHYTRESGLMVERRARRLAAWAGSNAPQARERAARLTQAAALLTLERVQHVHDALLPAARLAPQQMKDILARRLAPQQMKDILARRTDFKIEDIKRLKF